MEELKIRKLRKEDAEEVSKIYYSIVKTPEKIDFKRMFEEQGMDAAFSSSIAERQGRVVGYMISFIISAGFGIEKSAWITMLGVDPKYMGQGVGQGLAEAAFAFYRERGIGNIYTTVEWDSIDMLSFFKSLGFDRSEFVNLRKIIE